MTSGPVVVDTSARVEHVVDSGTGRAMAKRWPDRDRTIVPTLVQLELVEWGLRELDESRTDQLVAYTQKCLVRGLDTRLAPLAAEVYREHGLTAADAIVHATARHAGASLLTCDTHFDGLPSVVFEPKR